MIASSCSFSQCCISIVPNVLTYASTLVHVPRSNWMYMPWSFCVVNVSAISLWSVSKFTLVLILLGFLQWSSKKCPARRYTFRLYIKIHSKRKLIIWRNVYFSHSELGYIVTSWLGYVKFFDRKVNPCEFEIWLNMVLYACSYIPHYFHTLSQSIMARLTLREVVYHNPIRVEDYYIPCFQRKQDKNPGHGMGLRSGRGRGFCTRYIPIPFGSSTRECHSRISNLCSSHTTF